MRQRGTTLPTECDNNSMQIPRTGIQCGGGNSGFSIDWKGTMFACAMLPDIYAYPLVVGFAESWKYIHSASQIYPNPIECLNCNLRKLCTKCVAVHRSGANPGHANPRICEIARKARHDLKGELT